MTAAREIMKSFYDHPHTREAVQSASARLGVTCRITDNPNDGVVVIHDDTVASAPIIVELNESEKTLLLIAVGKAFSKMSRM